MSQLRIEGTHVRIDNFDPNVMPTGSEYYEIKDGVVSFGSKDEAIEQIYFAGLEMEISVATVEVKDIIEAMKVKNSIKLFVRAVSKVPFKELSLEGQEIAEITVVRVNAQIDESKLADAALDIYHSNTAFKHLDDFDFVVYKNEKILNTNENHESYSLAAEGYISK